MLSDGLFFFVSSLVFCLLIMFLFSLAAEETESQGDPLLTGGLRPRFTMGRALSKAAAIKTAKEQLMEQLMDENIR